MPRPALGSRLRDDIDDRDDINDGDGGNEADTLEPAQASQDTVTASAAESAEDIHHDAELPPLQTTSPRRRGGGILTLVILALVGMAIGFAVVVMLP